jgi:hypothetical protein
MKYLFAGLTILLISCSPRRNEYMVEQQILDCFYHHYNIQSIDIKSVLENVENVLIESKQLNDKSGKSYIEAFERIRSGDQDDLVKMDTYYALLSIDYIIPSSINCNDSAFFKIDSIDLVHSKINKFNRTLDSIVSRGKMDYSFAETVHNTLDFFGKYPKRVFIYLKINIDKSISRRSLLTERDFENDYYRSLGIMLLANEIISWYESQDWGFIRMLPPLPKES